MHKYKAILFDLFDTIINFNFRQLPTVEMNGIRSRTTSKEVYSVFERYYPEISFSGFYPYFIESYHQFQEMKLAEYREFPNRNRFILMLQNMKLTPNEKTDRLADEMVVAHMDGLAQCIEFPEENKRTLEKVKEKGYLTAIVSNFDYAPTAHALIDKYDIGRFFEQIVISEEVGWRKPKDIIFRRALMLLNIEPEDALFVGDNFSADVRGAKAVGIKTVWLNKNRASLQAEPPPDYTIEGLPQLNEILA
ncbi:MAG: HAD family hydrolase [Deltaproteobacteria bacterium]